MAKVEVRSDRDQVLLLSETVTPAHLDDEHSALQFLERLAWAVEDADGERRQLVGITRHRAAASHRGARLPERVRELIRG